MPTLYDLFSTDAAISNHLQDRYVRNDADQKRRKDSQFRDALYSDGGDSAMRALLDTWFKDREVRALRKAFVQWAKSNNFLRRIVREQATVYLEAARRTVANMQSDARYQELQTATAMNAAMRQADRMLALHNDVLLGFRVRQERADFRRPIVDVITPGRFFVIAHPSDHTWPIGVGVWHGAEGLREDAPHWRVWTDVETLSLDANGRVIRGSVEPNPIGRMPFVLIHEVQPAHRGAMLDGTTGADLVAAHLSVWLQNVLLLKESKSANRQTAFSGDIAATPTGQTSDTEADLILGEGVTAQTLDRGMDLAQFRETADHIEERAAGNRGIPPSILRHAGATSGHEIELRLLPIKTIRAERILVMREAEREAAQVMAAVTRVDMPRLAFNPDGWKIDFGEVQVPLSAGDQTAVFQADRTAGLTNTVDELIRRNGDMDEADALAAMLRNIAIEVTRVAAMRPLATANASMGQSTEEPQAEENGARAHEHDDGEIAA